MQCKDISTSDILLFLYDRKIKNKSWGTWYSGFNNSIPYPKDTPDKIIIAKMRNLILKELVDGCPCGCRGDYTITDLGITWLKYRNLIKE